MAELAERRLSADAMRLIDAVIDRCRAGDFDDDDRPARIHGDLWSGNVMWTADGVVLIDPAAHGGHRETDLAMLALFGCPYLDEVLSGYQSVRPLREGWRERVGLHQLYPLAGARGAVRRRLRASDGGRGGASTSGGLSYESRLFSCALALDRPARRAVERAPAHTRS